MSTLSDSKQRPTTATKKRSLFRRFLSLNSRASRTFDRIFLPSPMIQQGYTDFKDGIAKPFINMHNITIYDVGGGSRPYISVDHKVKYNQTIMGLDISANELSQAPDGAYDKIIAHDLTTYFGAGDADVIICQSTLEHVHSNSDAFRAIASILKTGGHACIFTPSRYAAFARLNMILPQKIKEKILFTLYPRKAEGHDGFKAYYDKCTPKEFRKLAADNGMETLSLNPYFKSTYFEICFPVYIVWRIWQLVFRVIAGENAAETFAIVLRKKL